MTTSWSIILTAICVFLLIFLPIAAVKISSKRKYKKKKDYFLQACERAGFHVALFMFRKNKMAALSTQESKIATVDFSESGHPEVVFALYDKNAKPTLKVLRNKNVVQKITLQPVYDPTAKSIPPIVFYDMEDDDLFKMEAFRKEAEAWEKAILIARA